YKNLAKRLIISNESPYIDLGFPALPLPQEFLAAALWLSHKSEADPFKGILKIVALLKYVESDFKDPILCNEVKKAVLTAAPHDLPIDPYIMTINSITKHGAASLTDEQLDLLRVSALMKIIGGGDKPFCEMEADSPKKKIINLWAESWGWPSGRLMHFANYHHWAERDRLDLGNDLLAMLIKVYTRIAYYLISHYPGQVDPQEAKLVPLAASILSRHSGLKATVEPLPSYLHRKSISDHLLLARDDDFGTWNLYSLGRGQHIDDFVPSAASLIFNSNRVGRVGAWLVNNKLYSPKMCLTIKVGAKANLSLRAFADFLAKIHKHLPPFNFSEKDVAATWSAGGNGPTLVVLNFEMPPEYNNLSTADFIYRTGWGEMRHHYVNVDCIGSMADKYLHISKAIAKESDSLLDEIIFHTAETPQMQKIVMNIKGAIAAIKHGRRTVAARTSKSRLDV
ncbi:MAG: class I adenylate cyclase, partial [Candidatus Adiutrix sp.]